MNVKKIDDLIDLLQQTKDIETSKTILREYIQSNKVSDWGLSRLFKSVNYPEFAIECFKDYKSFNLKLDFIIIFMNTYTDFFFKKFEDILDIFKKEDNYERFIRNQIGEVELDRNNNPIIPKELKELFSLVADSNNMKDFRGKLPEIISKWELIKKQILYKKATHLLNDDLELQGRIKEIISAVNVLKRKMPQNASEMELYNTPGFEVVGSSNRYTQKPETAVERSYEIATKMDRMVAEKKFPDFSLETDDIVVEVCHPQDKSAMFFGYDTDCCFIPNGVADKSDKIKDNFVDYCLTTPYGGVVRFKSKDNGQLCMGSQILRNGNMLMFHSYESKNEKEDERVDYALKQSAKKAIELSNGKIKVVFMGNLHSTRLNLKDKIIIGSNFKAYTEAEYEKYANMHNNLNERNIVLAFEYNGKVLIGNEIVEFFNQECRGDNKEFVKKLGLEYGEVNDTYEFQRRKMSQKINIDNSKLVGTFYQLYKTNEKERTILALIKEKRRLERKTEKSPEVEKLLNFIEQELRNYPEANMYHNLDEKQIASRLKRNFENSCNLFAGDSIETIIDFYGITEEEINHELEEIVERESKNKKISHEKMSEKAKRAKNQLISQIIHSNNENLLLLKQKIARGTITIEELNELKQQGIVTKDYEEAFINKQKTVDSEKSLQDKKRNQIRQMKKNTRIIEKIVAEKLFSNVTDEELEMRMYKEVSKEVKFKIYQYYLNQAEGKMIAEDEKERISGKIHELYLEATIKEYIEKGIIREDVAKKLNLYGIDLQAICRKHSGDKDTERRKIRLEKLDKLKASVTIGIRKKENWIGIKNRITQGKYQNTEKEPITERAIYGNSWYIEFLVGEKPVIYIREDAIEEEKADLKEALKEELKRIDTFVSMDAMEKIASKVPKSKIEEAKKVIEDMLKSSFERNS